MPEIITFLMLAEHFIPMFLIWSTISWSDNIGEFGLGARSLVPQWIIAVSNFSSDSECSMCCSNELVVAPGNDRK